MLLFLHSVFHIFVWVRLCQHSHISTRLCRHVVIDIEIATAQFIFPFKLEPLRITTNVLLLFCQRNFAILILLQHIGEQVCKDVADKLTSPLSRNTKSFEAEDESSQSEHVQTNDVAVNLLLLIV